MKLHVKPRAYFSGGERRGVSLLALLLLAACFGSHYVHTKERDDHLMVTTEPAQVIASPRGEHRYARRERRENNRRRVLAPFDPNRADSLSFRRLGLPAWMVKNILKYRAKGGVFHKPADFRKVYGLSDDEYAELQPYITLAPQEPARSITTPLYTPLLPDSVKVFKYPFGTHLNLNRSDTTELKKVPGIGSGIARMIVGYRERLGGFYRIEQLAEIGLNTDTLRAWFTIDTVPLRRIKINNVGVEHLRVHPYINFYQAKALVEYRKRHGSLHSLKPFRLYEEFTPDDLERIGHYLSFE